MRYVFHLLDCDVKFTHAGQGTAFPNNMPRKPFVKVRSSMLGEKNILMHRNPLDTAVSMFFQIHKHDPVSFEWRCAFRYLKAAMRQKLPPKDITEFVLHPVWGLENICRYNLAWLDHFATLPDSLVISYEKAREDLAGVVRELADFAGALDVDIEKIVMQSFSNPNTLNNFPKIHQ